MMRLPANTGYLSKDGARYTGINSAQVVPVERIQEFRPQLSVEFLFHLESFHQPHVFVITPKLRA